MYDVIIIGKGPAGLSAALYTVRANLKTLILAKGYGALEKAEKIENYFGFSSPISGLQLLHESERQAQRLGCEMISDEVVAIEKNDLLEVTTTKGRFQAKAVLLATGQPQKKIHIENLDSFEGRGVSYCTTCDGFFYKNLKVGVLGFKDYAIHEAVELLAFTENVTIYTNGEELDISDRFLSDAEKFRICKRKIEKIAGTDFIEQICFSDGECESLDGLFIAYESASSVDFARKLGVMTEGSSVIVDRDQKTNLEGIFAAGDCTGGFKQISTAVGQGAMAARSMIDYVRSINNK